MTVRFGNAILAGNGNLIVPGIQSPNYAPGVAGWQIRKDGSAEFNNVLIRGGLDTRDLAGIGLTIDDTPGFRTTILWHDGASAQDPAITVLTIPGAEGTMLINAGNNGGQAQSIQLDSDAAAAGSRHVRISAEDGVLINGTAPFALAEYFTTAVGVNILSGAANAAIPIAPAGIIGPNAYDGFLLYIGTIELRQLAAGAGTYTVGPNLFATGLTYSWEVSAGQSSQQIPFQFASPALNAGQPIGGQPSAIVRNLAGVPTIRVVQVSCAVFFVPSINTM